MSQTKSTQISFHVSGMHCASCAANIQRRINKLPGVIEARVNYGNEQAIVAFDQQKIKSTKIAEVVTQLGYKAHLESDQVEDLADKERTIELIVMKQQLMIAGGLTGLLLIGTMIPGAPAWLKNPLVMWALATPVQFWIGKRYYQSALSAFKNRTTNMDTLVVMGTSVAYFYSVIVLIWADSLANLGIEPQVYFETAATILTLVLLGKFLELKTKGQTSRAIKELMQLQPLTANKKIKGEFMVVPIAQVIKDDWLLVKPGEKIPVDGKVIESESLVNESMVNGESMPVTKKVGDEVIGGTININRSLTIQATRVGKDSFLASMIALTQAAAGSRPSIQKLVDQISEVFVPAVIVLAFLTLIVWLIWGPSPQLPYALNAMVAVLIIACPCALGLATPTSLMVGIGRGAKMGILIKDAEVLEVANRLKAIIFDKTGTLTQGKPMVHQVMAVRKEDETIFVDLAKQSNHPLAQAISLYGKERELTHRQLRVTEIPGQGIEGTFNHQNYYLGNEAWMRAKGITIPLKLHQAYESWQKQAMTIVLGANDLAVTLAFGIKDQVRPKAKLALSKLKRMGIKPLMMTGDTQATAKAVATELNLSDYKAQVKPQEKEACIRSLRQNYGVVGMVGDGINDAPALAGADVSIAMGGGTQIAIQSASVVLLRDDITLVPQAISLSRAVIKNIQQNLGWAFGYNLILIPIAMGGLYPIWGLTLNPMLAALAMAFSSVSVVINALRLQQVKLG